MYTLLTALVTDWRGLLSTAAGLALFLVASRCFRRKGAATARASESDLAEESAVSALAGAKPKPAATDRRTQPRWVARKICVTVADADSDKLLGVSTVFDRSMDGIRLVGTLQVAPGSRLKIRAGAPPEDGDWARVEVRHCQRADGSWVLGCRFTEPPSWDVSTRLG